MSEVRDILENKKTINIKDLVDGINSINEVALLFGEVEETIGDTLHKMAMELLLFTDTLNTSLKEKAYIAKRDAAIETTYGDKIEELSKKINSKCVE